MAKKGWHNESARHSLASKGIRTHKKRAIWHHTRHFGYNMTPEEMERLYNTLHANYTEAELRKMSPSELRAVVKDLKKEWRY